MRKKLPIGISDFKELVDSGCTYIDKTLLVKEVVEKGTKVALIPRMRRFGKTLNLSMLRYFFEKREENLSYLFKDLNIWKDEKYRKMQGQFPVIFISFKDVKYLSWEETFEAMRELISQEFQRHRYLIEGTTLFPEEKEDYQKIIRKEANQALLAVSLLRLTAWMHRYHQKTVIILIDEYDTPAHTAYVGKYYETFISFLRNWLSGGLKDNVHLERGVLTGILRIAKESIFSGLNNISTFTVMHETFSDKFGLLESEVVKLLEDYGLQSRLSEIREWYDGYHIGSCKGIYNPWSVLKCIEANGSLAPYWVNTSDNALMKQLLTQGSDDLKADMEALLKGEAIERKIEEGIIFSELEKSPSVIWSVLLYSGYLTIDAIPSYGALCQLRIPNIEVSELYKSVILDWFGKSINENKYKLLLSSLITGDIDTFSQIFREFLLSSVSIFDVPAEESEKIYHAFILGMLIGLKDKYEVRSNRESGLGRYDVMLIPKNLGDLGIIMEFKKISPFKKMDLETAVNSALKQIEEKHYAQEFLDRGINRILYLGLAFEGKNVLIRHKFKA